VPLLWRIFVGNAIVLGVATTVLVVTPLTVSFPAAERELLVLGLGLAVMLLVNFLLLRGAFAATQRGHARGGPARARASRAPAGLPGRGG